MAESVLNISVLSRPAVELEGRAPQALSSRANDLKSAVHRDLINKLDLEKLMLIPDGRARQQMLGVIHQLVGQQEVPLSAIERDILAREVMDAGFGLGA